MVVKGQAKCGAGHLWDSLCLANEVFFGLLVLFKLIKIEERYIVIKQMSKYLLGASDVQDRFLVELGICFQEVYYQFNKKIRVKVSLRII